MTRELLSRVKMVAELWKGYFKDLWFELNSEHQHPGGTHLVIFVIVVILPYVVIWWSILILSGRRDLEDLLPPPVFGEVDP